MHGQCTCIVGRYAAIIDVNNYTVRLLIVITCYYACNVSYIIPTSYSPIACFLFINLLSCLPSVINDQTNKFDVKYINKFTSTSYVHVTLFMIASIYNL